MVEPTTAPPTAEAPAPTEAVNEPAPDAQAGGVTIYQITQDESEVRFNIFEELRGSPKDVIGVSNQVAGEAAVDLSDLSATQVGVIQINARTLETDDSRRNQAIRNRILFTDQYEFITFTPTGIMNLDGSAEQGQTLTFQIEGDLTIRDVTQPVVFEVNATVESEGRIVGSASSSVTWADFGLSIPDVPMVANVGDDVALEMDFVLLAQ
jgi:polyisoprenoid-binding protein YceI